MGERDTVPMAHAPSPWPTVKETSDRCKGPTGTYPKVPPVPDDASKGLVDRSHRLLAVPAPTWLAGATQAPHRAAATLQSLPVPQQLAGVEPQHPGMRSRPLPPHGRHPTTIHPCCSQSSASGCANPRVAHAPLVAGQQVHLSPAAAAAPSGRQRPLLLCPAGVVEHLLLQPHPRIRLGGVRDARDDHRPGAAVAEVQALAGLAPAAGGEGAARQGMLLVLSAA